ncbi:MAG: uroporphyrinogen-III synthase [Candidatus Rokubacteria bacterium]|nr:uroporphyrinogen-III synthase [Candidatus Rokubacteria bacterium]
MSTRTLQGKTVALTEGRRATELARLVEKLGGVPYPAPAVREIPRRDLGPATAVLAAILRGEVPIIVFLTGVGTQAFFTLADQRGDKPALLDTLGRMLVAARGPKPAAVLRGAGVRIDVAPAEPTSDAVLAALASHDLAGQTVAVQHYGEDPLAFTDGLAARGARVLDIPLYEWALPEDEVPLERFVADACSGRIDVVAFTSSPQVKHVFAVAERLGRARELARALDEHVATAVVGPVCAAYLASLGITPKIVAPKGTMGALVHAIAESLQ